MPRVYIIGDSTVEDNTPPFRGWGWALPRYAAEGVTVHNHALSGRSSKSFFNEGLFAPVREGMEKGGLLLIQFGHNDEKDDEERPDSLLYTHGEYAPAVRDLARWRCLPLIDLEERSRALYLSLGEEGAAELFVRLKKGEHPDFPDGHDDRTHFNAHGAEMICALVAEGLRADERTRAFVR